MQGFSLMKKSNFIIQLLFNNLVALCQHDICLFCWLEPTLLFSVRCNGSLPIFSWNPEAGSHWGPSGGSTCLVFSLPQSQGDSSKNSVVSSNSTKDSSMSSSAPMVPQFFYFIFSLHLMLLFIASFPSFSSSLVLSPQSLFLYRTPHVE